MIVGALLAVLIFELVKVFKMQTYFFESETIINIEPKMTIISTFQNDSNYSPYMITTGFRSAGCASTKTVKAYYYQVENLLSGSPTINSSEIILEQCTAEHFSIVPSLSEKIQQVGIGNVMCLPLNKR